MKSPEIIISEAVTLVFWQPRQESVQELTVPPALTEITRSAALSPKVFISGRRGTNLIACLIKVREREEDQRFISILNRMKLLPTTALRVKTTVKINVINRFLSLLPIMHMIVK